MKLTIKARELKLGDRVEGLSLDNAFSTCIVQKVDDTEVTLFRPYGVTAGSSYTGGVICYVGIETYKVPRNDRPFIVLQREELR